MSKPLTVTPLLDVGGGDDDVQEAVARIKLRQRANVTDLDTAREVMRALGMDEELIEDRVHFALTGEVLVAR